MIETVLVIESIVENKTCPIWIGANKKLVIESIVENKTCLIWIGANKKLVTNINGCIYYVTVIILISHFLNVHTT